MVAAFNDSPATQVLAWFGLSGRKKFLEKVAQHESWFDGQALTALPEKSSHEWDDPYRPNTSSSLRPDTSHSFRPDTSHSFRPDTSHSNFVADDDDIPILSQMSYNDQQRKVNENIIIVKWSHSKDPENPRNWSNSKKFWVVFVICIYTFVVYCASSICVPSVPYIMAKYNVSETTAALDLACYVLGYGIGPMIFAPLSEIPAIGRNLPYVCAFAVFLTVSIIIAVVDNFPVFVALRFLQGFFGSPALATGAASIEDIFSVASVPYAFIFWVAAMYGGPALGPLLAGYAVATDWRWPLYEIAIMAGLTFPLLLLLPETSADNILLRKARRMRRVSGNMRYKAMSEMKNIAVGRLILQSMIKPLEITIKDPAILFTCLYSLIIYSIYYSFFEVFPLVYGGIFQFTSGEIGLVFLVIIAALLIVAPIYAGYLKWFFMPKFYTSTYEDRLFLALFATWFPPVGLFVFAWTSGGEIHWIWPTIGIGIYAGSSFIVFQCLICYIPLSYPKYVASLLAANDFCRSLAAAALVMTSRKMYLGMGIQEGVSLLGGLSFIGVIGMLVLYYFGATMRKRSKFAESS